MLEDVTLPWRSFISCTTVLWSGHGQGRDLAAGLKGGSALFSENGDIWV